MKRLFDLTLSAIGLLLLALLQACVINAVDVAASPKFTGGPR